MVQVAVNRCVHAIQQGTPLGGYSVVPWHGFYDPGRQWRVDPGDDGPKRRKGSKVHVAVDTLGHLLALHVTPANEPERDQVAVLSRAVQEVTGESVELVFVDQGYTGDEAEADAASSGIQLHVVSLPEAKRGFVLLPRRWVVERSYGWMARFRRSARGYERLSETLKGLHYVAFSILMLHKAAPHFQWSS